MGADTSPRPDTPRIDKAAVLNAFYSYLGSRLDSVGRRASFTLALLGSFIGVASASLTRGQPVPIGQKLLFLLSHPSIIFGIAAIIILLVSEIAKIRPSNDLLSRIGFSDEAVGHLHQVYLDSTINDLFGEMIKNTRVVGEFLRKKVRLYNAGAVLFVVSITLFACGW